MANQFLSLALFLMLLSFFIVMNGMSSYEEYKAKSVINSISLAFSSDISDNNRAPDTLKKPLITVGQGDSLDDIEGLFNAHISGFEASRNRFGTNMHVRTSIGQFENAIDISDYNYMDKKEGERGSFLMTLVTLLRSEETGNPYRMDMVVNLPNDPAVFQKENPDEFIYNLKRVSKFANILEKVGMPKKMISIALAEGESGMIDLYFYRYKPMKLPSNIVRGDL